MRNWQVCVFVLADMDHTTEILLALGLILLTGGLSFAVILIVYRLCCHADGGRHGKRRVTSVPRDDADRMLLGGSRSDVKQLKRSAVRTETRVAGLYAGVRSLR